MDKESAPTEEYIRQSRETIGKHIRIYSEENGYSREELAERKGVRSVTISKIEAGNFSITVDYVAKFA